LEKPLSPDAGSSKGASQTPATSHSSPIYSSLALFLPFSLLGGVTVFRLRRRSPHSIKLLSLLALVGLLTVAGCGHSSPPAATSKTYTITVTATSGTLSHSATESVTIQ
jgi:peptidoglycan/LPS O-acetylase OafA/YrhL